METCSMCGKEKKTLLFTVVYNDTIQKWDVGEVKLCEECANEVMLTDELQPKKETRRHGATTQ